MSQDKIYPNALLYIETEIPELFKLLKECGVQNKYKFVSKKGGTIFQVNDPLFIKEMRKKREEDNKLGQIYVSLYLRSQISNYKLINLKKDEVCDEEQEEIHTNGKVKLHIYRKQDNETYYIKKISNKFIKDSDLKEILPKYYVDLKFLNIDFLSKPNNKVYIYTINNFTNLNHILLPILQKVSVSVLETYELYMNNKNKCNKKNSDDNDDINKKLKEVGKDEITQVDNKNNDKNNDKKDNKKDNDKNNKKNKNSKQLNNINTTNNKIEDSMTSSSDTDMSDNEQKKYKNDNNNKNNDGSNTDTNSDNDDRLIKKSDKSVVKQKKFANKNTKGAKNTKNIKNKNIKGGFNDNDNNDNKDINSNDNKLQKTSNKHIEDNADRNYMIQDILNIYNMKSNLLFYNKVN